MSEPFMPVADVTDDTMIDTGNGFVRLGDIRKWNEKPNYVPVHRLPVWLSSEDDRDAIIKLAEAGVDKAACWDFQHAIHMLCERGRSTITGDPA